MNKIKIRQYADSDQEKVIKLWELCELTRQWNNPIKDIQRKLIVQSELFLVLEKDDEILGSIMGGFDGHRGSVNYLGIHPKHKNKGFGKLLMKKIVSVGLKFIYIASTAKSFP